MPTEKDFQMNKINRKVGYFPASFFQRRERMTVDDSGFHVRIRKGIAIGPFSSELEAKLNLSDFLASQQITN